MAVRCATNTNLVRGAEAPNGMGNEATSKETSASPDMADISANAGHKQTRNAVINDLENAFDPNAPLGVPLSAGDNRHVRAFTRWLTPLIDKIDQYRQKRADLFLDASNTANGTTMGEASRWFNMTNWIRTKFMDERAAFSKWVWGFARSNPELAPYAQPITQMLDTALPQIQGFKNDFRQRRRALEESLRPVSRRTGFSINYLADMGGHYATLLHIPEANAELIRGWRAEAEGMRQELNSGQRLTDKQRVELEDGIAKLEAQADTLEINLNEAEKPEGLLSAGYTNRQAENLMEIVLQKTGMTREEADAFAAALTNEFNYVVQRRAEAGLVSRQQLEAFPDFQHYVALMSKQDNLLGVANDAGRYDPGSYHARDGMINEPDSAFMTLAALSDRAATEMGMQELAINMYALHQKALDAGQDIGLRSRTYSSLMRDKRYGSGRAAAEADNILNAGGLVVDAPVVKNGELSFERHYIWFKSDWNGGDAMRTIMGDANMRTGFDDLSGAMLNRALTSTSKLGKGIEWLGKATSYHGQMFTRMSLGFAPISGLRDGMERLFHISNRTYFDDAGNKISNRELAFDFIRNSSRATSMLFDAMRHGEGAETRAQLYLKEYRENGMFQQFTPGVYNDVRSLEQMIAKRPDRLQDKLKRPEMAFLDRWTQEAGYVGQQALQKLDQWNDFFQNISPFAQFVSLREKGVSAQRAAKYVIQEMNMSQRGQLTPYMRIISPFVTPTVQSAAALARTLGLTAAAPKDIIKQGYRGWLAVLGGMAAFSMLGEFEKESMGYDEQGNSRYDNMKPRDLAGYLAIGLDEEKGTFAKFALGFGPVRMARILAICTDRVKRGLMTPEQMAAEMIFTTAKDIVPAGQSQIDFTKRPGAFIMEMLTPDIIKPIMEIQGNTNYFGSSIADEPRKDTARADQGRASTHPFWHQVARFFQRDAGLMDVPPEHYKHLVESYGAGPIRLLGVVFNAINKRMDSPTASNYDPDGLDGLMPWLRAFGGTYYIGRQQDITRGMYYDYKRELTDKIEHAGLKLSQNKDSANRIPAVEYRRQVLADSGLFTEEEIQDYETIYNAEKVLGEMNTDFNNNYKEAYISMDYPEQLTEKFREMGEAKKEIYQQAVQSMNYYRNRR